MLKFSRNKKIKRLEPKKAIILNDIDIKEYDLSAVSTIIMLSVLFLVSMKLFLIMGNI